MKILSGLEFYNYISRMKDGSILLSINHHKPIFLGNMKYSLYSHYSICNVYNGVDMIKFKTESKYELKIWLDLNGLKMTGEKLIVLEDFTEKEYEISFEVFILTKV